MASTIHSLRTAFKPGRKIKEMKARAQQPLGEKHNVRSSVRRRNVEVVREKQGIREQSEINEGMRNGRTAVAEERMGREDGGLTKQMWNVQKE